MAMQNHEGRVVAEYQPALTPWGSGINYKNRITNRDGVGVGNLINCGRQG